MLGIHCRAWHKETPKLAVFSSVLPRGACFKKMASPKGKQATMYQ